MSKLKKLLKAPGPFTSDIRVWASHARGLWHLRSSCPMMLPLLAQSRVRFSEMKKVCPYCMLTDTLTLGYKFPDMEASVEHLTELLRQVNKALTIEPSDLMDAYTLVADLVAFTTGEFAYMVDVEDEESDWLYWAHSALEAGDLVDTLTELTQVRFKEINAKVATLDPERFLERCTRMSLPFKRPTLAGEGELWLAPADENFVDPALLALFAPVPGKPLMLLPQVVAKMFGASNSCPVPEEAGARVIDTALTLYDPDASEYSDPAKALKAAFELT